MEQINNWNILVFISFAHSHIDGLVILFPGAKHEDVS